MNRRRLSLSTVLAVASALALAAAWPAHLRAQDARAAAGAHHDDGGRRGSNELIKVARAATERYKDVAAAEADGYALMFGCVSGEEAGAMGMHYVNLGLVTDGVLDPARPEIVIYEPQPGGGLKLVAADYLVFAQDWHKANAGTSQIMGQLLHLFQSPNRFGLPDFYTLHVWAWKDNPNGAFVNWHPKVSCDGFSGQPR